MILLTPGDPAGIGPEVMLVAWRDRGPDVDAGLAGDPRIWSRAAERLKMDPSVLPLVGRPDDQLSVPDPGAPTLDGARLAWQALDEALEMAANRSAAAIVTGPISKKHMTEAGFPHAGHTEYLASAAGVPRVLMVMSDGDRFHVGLHTVHVPLRQVPDMLDENLMVQDLQLLQGFVSSLYPSVAVRLGVCGLNPHAGEGGLLGTEDTIVDRAVQLAMSHGLDATGPVPGDTVFAGLRDGQFDAVLAMYHDQGLAPFKVLHFDKGVNVTVGLPWVRTSPDHGTAFDIAGTGSANPDSARAALELARRLLAVSSGG